MTNVHRFKLKSHYNSPCCGTHYSSHYAGGMLTQWVVSLPSLSQQYFKGLPFKTCLPPCRNDLWHLLLLGQVHPCCFEIKHLQ